MELCRGPSHSWPAGNGYYSNYNPALRVARISGGHRSTIRTLMTLAKKEPKGLRAPEADGVYRATSQRHRKAHAGSDDRRQWPPFRDTRNPNDRLLLDDQER